MKQAPFDEGLIVVMDGMGETLDAMAAGRDEADDKYTHELSLENHPSGLVELPLDAADKPHGLREAETVYSFRGGQLQRVFKRWVRHRSPPELYNHGFENLESLGALYSRVASHIFGDWNACGKVMGLAPWAAHWADDERSFSLLRGELDGELRIEWAEIESLPHANGWKKLAAAEGALPPGLAEQRAFHTRLAASVQRSLEAAVLPFLGRLRERTGERNLALAGGVALNSVLNGRIARESGFEGLFIPPCPADEGIALGCAAFALHELLPRLGHPASSGLRAPLSAYQGKEYSEHEISLAIEEFSPWLVDVSDSFSLADNPAVEAAVGALLEGEIIGWFQAGAVHTLESCRLFTSSQ